MLSIEASFIILSILLTIATTRLLYRSKLFEKTKHTNGSRYLSIDGLRGYLALSVFLHHYFITFHWKATGAWTSPDEPLIENLGIVGVSLFFVITGFLFTGKLNNQNLNWVSLYKSRVYRIYPLYLFALLVISFFAYQNQSYQITSTPIELIKEYIYWAIYYGVPINGFEDTRKVIAGVDWTLKYEWIYYLALPLIYFILKSKILTLLLSLLITASFLFPVEFGRIDTTYFILFLIGGLCHYASVILKNNTKILFDSKFFSSLSVILIVLALLHKNSLDVTHIVIITLIFLLISCGNSVFGILKYRSSLVLGEISYSIYLLHGVVLYIAFSKILTIPGVIDSYESFLYLLPIITSIVVTMSFLTFKFIEKPFIELGRKNISQSRANNP